jgi:DNA-binding PadR family transcriptional regulator
VASQRLLGEVEQMLLLAVLRLGEAAYAVSIREEICLRAGLTLSRGTIYITLDRLETKGYLRSRFADPTPERGGKAKRYFKPTPAALRALRASRQALLKMWDGVQPLGERT